MVNMAWVPDVMRNQELEKVLEVSNSHQELGKKIEKNVSNE